MSRAREPSGDGLAGTPGSTADAPTGPKNTRSSRCYARRTCPISASPPPTARPATSRARSRSSRSRLRDGNRCQTLLGATGTGKTATMAWVIEELQRPALVIAHNKTLAAQLCNEFREFFPDERRRVLRLLLRLLPARGVRPAGRPLHREGLVAERRHRAAAARRRRTSLVTRRDVVVVASVSLHLRARLAGGVARADARPRRSARSTTATRSSASSSTSSTCATTRCSAAGASASRATSSRCSPRTWRPPTGSRSSATRSSRSRTSTRSRARCYAQARQPRHLAGDGVRHLEADDRACRRRDPRRARGSRSRSSRPRAGCSRRTGSASAPSTTWR